MVPFNLTNCGQARRKTYEPEAKQENLVRIGKAGEYVGASNNRDARSSYRRVSLCCVADFESAELRQA